jgi:hypothetical protein
MHNFHIHQSKFRLADARLDQGTPPGLVAIVSTDPTCVQQPPNVAFCDPLGVVGKSVPEAGGAIPNLAADVWHDTIPVPPRDSAGHPGRVFVSIPFKSPEQEGQFVFHCHILEHEDAGMMAPVEVLSAATIARQQQDEPISPMGAPGKKAESRSIAISSFLRLFDAISLSSDPDVDAALATSICSSGASATRQIQSLKPRTN